MATLLETGTKDGRREEELGGQMSFLEHLDELRKRLIRSILFIFVALVGCWFISDHIYNFLAVPIKQALAEAQRRELPLGGLTGQETIQPLASLKEGDTGRYVFAEATKLGASTIPPGTSVQARVAHDTMGNLGVFTDEPLYAGNTVIPKGVRLPLDFNAKPDALPGIDDKLIVTTAIEPFSLYVKVSLYAAFCLSVPFLLLQIWGFISPGLYPHERTYALPFVFLSSVSFLLGAAFAYRVIFPPAAKYLLGLGQDFRLLLKADDYFDFIILVMLAMGIAFRCPRSPMFWRASGSSRRACSYDLEDFPDRDPDLRSHTFADQRHSEHDALCPADDPALHHLDLYRLDLRQSANNFLRDEGGGRGMNKKKTKRFNSSLIPPPSSLPFQAT